MPANQLGQRGIVQGLDVLRIDPSQLGFIELRRAFSEVIQVEPVYELLTRENFIIAMTPTKRAK